jgi:Tfp pilus assembly protein PilN
MPLPQKVIEQLGREPTETQGWAVGALLFSGGMLFLALVIYFGLTLGYEPYLQNQLDSTQSQVSALNNSISTGDQAQLIDFYSQITNLQGLLKNHTHTSQFFSWLEANTEANVYYQSLTLTSQDQVTLAGSAATEADVNQQVAIFESSPQVSSLTVSGVVAPQATSNAGWTFTMALIMQPSVFLISGQ